MDVITIGWNQNAVVSMEIALSREHEHLKRLTCIVGSGVYDGDKAGKLRH